MRSRIAALVVKRLQEGPATWKQLKKATDADPSHLHKVVTIMRQDGIVKHKPYEPYSLSLFPNGFFSKDGNRLLLDADSPRTGLR